MFILESYLYFDFTIIWIKLCNWMLQTIAC